MNIHETIQLALQHYRSGNLSQAEEFCKIVLEEQPANAEMLYFLGVIQAQLENPDLAIQYIEKSLNFNTENADAYVALGVIKRQKGLLDEAISFFQKAISLDPTNAETYNHLGDVLKEKGQINEAITSYQKAIQINPENADLYHKVGMLFQLKGSIDEALHYYQKAIQISPHLQRTYNNIGIVLQEKGFFDEAIACYRKALIIDPDLTEAHYNLGNLLHREGKRHEALVSYDKAISINPNYFIARWAKCIAQLPIIYQDQADIEVSRRHYHEELMKLTESVVLDTSENINIAAEAVGVHQPFFLAYQGFNNRDLQQIYGELVCKIMSSRYPNFSIRPVMPPHVTGEPLRIGIVSGKFYYHPVLRIIINGWTETLDRNKIQLYGYYTDKRKDQETEKARRCFYRFIDSISSFEDLCKTILDDNLHVIIYPEIGMDFTTLRLAALRLAPIQCVAWGHPDTSGLPTIDYYLSSEMMEPSDGDNHYTESLVRLANLSIYYSPDEIQTTKLSRDSLGLRPKSVLYHCCQTLYKFLPQYDDIFPRIAQQAGDCQFLFSSLPEVTPVIEQFRMRVFQAFNRFHLNAADYVVFVPFLDQVKYKALNLLCDVFLDPIGWSGCTSTLEAIDCNIPVIASPGLLMRGRESSAILTMMGMKETIAASLDDYVTLAVKLGQNSEWRREISEKIERNKHIIYKDRTCIYALENFLERAVQERSI